MATRMNIAINDAWPELMEELESIPTSKGRADRLKHLASIGLRATQVNAPLYIDPASHPGGAVSASSGGDAASDSSQDDESESDETGKGVSNEMRSEMGRYLPAL